MSRRCVRMCREPPASHPRQGKPAPIEGTGASRVDIAALFFHVFGDVLIGNCLGMRVVLAILENLVDQKFGWNGWSAARSD